jgi:NAD(P)-dependent dehydrogenase (short-subunit alcohol dehydrogenase family)
MKVRNKIVAVTGGGNGLGRASVLDLLSRGASVAAVDIDESALKETVELARDRQDRLTSHVADVTDRGAVEALPGQVISHHGAVDGLINSAGIIQPFVRVNDLAYEAIERLMNVNFYGTLYMAKAFLPHLLARPEGHIVNIASTGAFLAVPGQTIYGASKAAVKLLTEGLRGELQSTNVRVTLIFPGLLDTDIAANSGVEARQLAISNRQGVRTLTPDRAAQIIVDGMERDRSRMRVGADAVFLDLISRLSPERAARLIYRLMGSLLSE